MLKFEHTEVVGWKHAIRGMRNPLESWEKSDSNIGFGTAFCIDCAYKNQNPCGQNCLDLGTNDLESHDPAAECWDRPSEVYADAGCLCRYHRPAVLVEGI